MPTVFLRSIVTGRPGWVVVFWVAVGGAMCFFAPNLTRLAAEGQANLLGRDAESRRADDALRRSWPDQAYESLVVAALHRSSGLTAVDLGYAARLADRIGERDRPKAVLRVLGPGSPPEVARRLKSRDGTVALVAVPLSTSFVAPATHEAVAWLQSQARADRLDLPEGLEVRWAGDALIGRDYMSNVQASLDRAAVATVLLLLGVLFAVYRSVWLALVPLATIGISLVISRSVLAWMTLAGWEVSPLVELFLVALLFGCGTDFCLFVSWRFGEHWDAGDPARAMRMTLERSSSDALDQRRHGDRRAVADGDDAVQAVFEHRPERGDRAGDHPGGRSDADARALDHRGPASPPRFHGADGTIVGAVGTCRPRGAGATDRELVGHGPGHGSPGGPGSPLEFRPGRHDRDAQRCDFGEKPPVARHQVRYGIAGAADGRARFGLRPERLRGPGAHR